MSAIAPINGMMPPITPAASAPAAPAGQPKADFGEMFKNYMQKVEGDQQTSGAAIQDLLTGKTQDVLPVVSAVAEADMSFKLLIGVRNKVIEAYKQTMNMQI